MTASNSAEMFRKLDNLAAENKTLCSFVTPMAITGQGFEIRIELALSNIYKNRRPI